MGALGSLLRVTSPPPDPVPSPKSQHHIFFSPRACSGKGQWITHFLSFLVIFGHFERSMVDPMSPRAQNRKFVKSREKNLKNEPNLTAVAQFVQKLFHIQGEFPGKSWWKMATPFHRIKNEFFSKSAKGMISLRLDLVSYTWALVRTVEKVWVIEKMTWRSPGPGVHIELRARDWKWDWTQFVDLFL